MKNVTYINAGAGSGKTYTLTQLLAEELSKGEIEFSQVILTTFTELAAKEFREKARVRILENDKYEVAAKMDSAAIGTVHSLALSFIKKFWYLLDYGADIQTISDSDEKFYINQSLSRILNERDQNGKLKIQPYLDSFNCFREYYGIADFQFWQKYLKLVMEKMVYYDVDEVDTSITKSMETLKQVFNKNIDADEKNELLAYLQKYYDFSLNFTTIEAKKQQQVILPLLKQCTCIHDLCVLVSDMKKPVGGPSKIENNCPGYTDFMAKLQEIQASTDNLLVLEPFVTAVFRLAKEWRDDYSDYKKRNRLISYNDMELLFLHLITTEKEVQDYIRTHYRLIMVDEFQDSNPIQLKIFNQLSELVADRGGRSYWVGDPKQAIYAFRGSDTDLVNSVAQHFHFHNDPKSTIHKPEGPDNLGTGRLVESWRSRPQLVYLVNDVFYGPFVQDKMNDLLIKLDPHFKDETLPDTPPIVHWECSEPNQDKAIAALAAQVDKLLQSKIKVHKKELDAEVSELSYRDVAILCRSNSDTTKIASALRKRNIPVSVAETDIKQRVEVQLVVTLLRFLRNTSNMHVRADLMRLLWGNSTEEILKDRVQYLKDNVDDENNPKEDKWKEDVVSELLEQVKRYEHLSIPEMVSGLIYECDIPALTAMWGDSTIRRQNLSTLQQLAVSYDQRCLQMGYGSSIGGFINYLNTTEPEAVKDNLSDTVKVLTYHKAKGLEWPVVVLYSLDDNKLEQKIFIKKSLMTVQEMVLDDMATKENPFDKPYFLHFFPYILSSDAYNTTVPQIIQDNIVALPIYSTLHEKAAREERRLLYVGMTRAKDQLISFGYKGKYNWLENAGVKNPSADNVWGLQTYCWATEDGSREFGDCQPKRIDVAVPDATTDKIREVAEEYVLLDKPKERTRFGRRYLSPSKLESFDGYARHTEWQEKGLEISTVGWGKDYSTIGSCIHDVFAVYQPGEDDRNREAALRVIAGYGLANQLSGHIDALIRSADWLYGQLRQRFPQGEDDGVDREYPFLMTLDSGQTLRGEMDLLWHYTDENGKHCVLVDYKSFAGVDLHTHTCGYYAQLSAYAAGLRKAGLDPTHALIYYPAHGVVHELRE